MDGQEFKIRGREMVDYIVQYLDEIESRRVTPGIEPGYLKHLIPDQPPEGPEPWENIMADVEDKIMIGMTHWQHPRSGNVLYSVMKCYTFLVKSY